MFVEWRTLRHYVIFTLRVIYISGISRWKIIHDPSVQHSVYIFMYMLYVSLYIWAVECARTKEWIYQPHIYMKDQVGDARVTPLIAPEQRRARSVHNLSKAFSICPTSYTTTDYRRCKGQRSLWVTKLEPAEMPEGLTYNPQLRVIPKTRVHAFGSQWIRTRETLSTDRSRLCIVYNT